MSVVEKAMRELVSVRGLPRSLYHWHQLTGLPASTFYAVVKGRRVPGVDVALKIARAGGVTVEAVFGDLVQERENE